MRLREHDRAERRERGGDRALALAFEPGEELDIRRLQAVPDLLDLGHLLAAEARQRLLGEPRRDADAQAAGDELQKREAAGGVEPVEPALDKPRPVKPRGGLKRLDDFGEARRVAFRPRCAGQTSAIVSARSPT